MNDAYVEWMVAQKTNSLKAILKYVLIGLTVLCAFASFMYGTLLFIMAIAFGVGAYFASIYTDVEFEYLYLDKEITVDKVYHKVKRKRFATYELDKIEVMAPIKSYHLDNYKNRQGKVIDISSGVENKPDLRYVFYYEGNQKIIFEPNEAMVKLMKNVAPRKVFTD